MKAETRRAWTEHAKGYAAAYRSARAELARPGRMGERTTVVDGLKFRSKLEADRYAELKLLRASGEVKWFLRQVPFDVAPGVIYRADFLVVWNLGGTVEKITVEDTKGFLTDTARVKLAVIEQRYRIKVTILTRKQVRKC